MQMLQGLLETQGIRDSGAILPVDAQKRPEPDGGEGFASLLNFFKTLDKVLSVQDSGQTGENGDTLPPQMPPNWQARLQHLTDQLAQVTATLNSAQPGAAPAVMHSGQHFDRLEKALGELADILEPLGVQLQSEHPLTVSDQGVTLASGSGEGASLRETAPDEMTETAQSETAEMLSAIFAASEITPAALPRADEIPSASVTAASHEEKKAFTSLLKALNNLSDRLQYLMHAKSVAAQSNRDTGEQQLDVLSRVETGEGRELEPDTPLDKFGSSSEQGISVTQKASRMLVQVRQFKKMLAKFVEAQQSLRSSSDHLPAQGPARYTETAQNMTLVRTEPTADEGDRLARFMESLFLFKPNTVRASGREVAASFKPVAMTAGGHEVRALAASAADPDIDDSLSDQGAQTGTASQDSTGKNTLSQAGSMSAPLSLPLKHPQWGAQLAQRVLFLAQNSQQVAQIRLHPAHLGPIQVKLKLEQDQSVQVSLHAHHALTREAIEQAVPRLKELFAQQGINLGEIQVQADAQGHAQAFADLRRQQHETHFGKGHSGAMEDHASPEESIPRMSVRQQGMIDHFV